jgi:hypothetical protein
MFLQRVGKRFFPESNCTAVALGAPNKIKPATQAIPTHIASPPPPSSMRTETVIASAPVSAEAA